jgi:dihydroflavonol-4-reductase
MPTAFVTGATGFLGLNLAEQLAAAGWDATCAHRASSNLSRLEKFPVKLAVADLLDQPAMEAAIPEGADAFFHVAGNTTLWAARAEEQTRDNVEGTRIALAAARARGVKRFIFTSTWGTYGISTRDMTEESPQLGGQGSRNYARTKYQAEQLVREAGASGGMDVVILNPANIIGRYDRGGWGRLFRLLDEGTMPGVPPGDGSFCHAAEVARAHVRAAEVGRGGESYILGGVNTSFEEVMGIIAELLGKPAPKPVPALVLRLLAQWNVLKARFTGVEPDLTPDGAYSVTQHPSVATDKAQRELGYRVIPLREILEDTHRWMVEEGLL